MKKGVFVLFLIALLLVPILATTIVNAQTAPAAGSGAFGKEAVSFSFSLNSIDKWSEQCREALKATYTIGTNVGSATYTSGGEIMPGTAKVGGDITQTNMGFFEKRLCLWLVGAPSIEDPNNRSLVGETLKYLVLILIIFLIYSVLKQIEFPKGMPTRIILSIIVGFLATFMITTDELITSMLSYTALGIAFTIFFPIFILGALTLFVATKASPIGIYFQKIAWLIYGLYVLIKAGLLALAKYYYNPTTGLYYGSGSYLEGIFKNFGLIIKQNGTETVPAMVSGSDMTTLIILIIVAIAVFLVGVKSNDMILTWLEKEKVQSAVESRKSQMDLARANEKLKAEDMMKK